MIDYNLPRFVHLRVHSAYSLLEGAIRFSTLADMCVKFNMPAVAVTDRNNLFGALEGANYLADKGVQPVSAATLTLYDGDGNNALGSIALYAKNETGYINLSKLVSAAHDPVEGRSSAGISDSILATHAEGLICLTGGPDGPVNQKLRHAKQDDARAYLSFLHELFTDNLYIELQRYYDFEPAFVEAALIEAAYDMAVPLVATNQCYFPQKEDYRAHDALICIAEGCYINEDDRRKLTPEHYLKSPEDICTLFADLPEALENTVEIARRCHFRPQERAPMLPSFATLDAQANIDETESESALLARHAQQGLETRIAQNDLYEQAETYQQRLAYELDIIKQMGYPGYFLIVADFIAWAKAQNIKVGPGRGSGAGSLVAWVLTITDLDPIKNDLLFERFLNPERISMPDFDIDFCQNRRDEVITYLQKKYGDEQIAQIITFGKLKARAVLRDVGRVLQMPYGQVDRLCKMVPNNPAQQVELAQVIKDEPRFAEERKNDENVDELLNIALKLEGLYRHASTHAAGVVIGDRPLRALIPLYRDPKSDRPLTQFSMKYTELAGLVKFDFLGLKTLTLIEYAENLVRASDADFEIAGVDFYTPDETTYALMCAGNTVGVFQLESKGMRDTLRKARPMQFSDIVALISLYRPGPMENIPHYIACKNGDEQPDYMHPDLEPILEETYGVIVYQEQVMQIAQVLAGYSLGDADLLRRAMGKKQKDVMMQQKAQFIEGAQKNNVPAVKADEIFERILPFAGYGFNKSHAAAYAVLSYQMAYIKAHYPLAFYAASMSLDYESTDKLDGFIRDARAHDIKILPPDINRSDVLFSIVDDAVIYGLAAIRNVGHDIMVAVVQERKAHGAFKDVFDFARRIGGLGLSRRMLENMAAAGVFDCFEPNRARVFAGISMILGEANIAHTESQSKQVNLFGDDEITEQLELPAIAPWLTTDRLTHERDAIGFFLSGHPLDDYVAGLKRIGVVALCDIDAQLRRDILIAGMIIKLDIRNSKRGRFAFVTLSDPGGQMEIAVFSDTFSKYESLLVVGETVVIGASILRDDAEFIRLNATGVYDIDKVLSNAAAGLRIFIDNEKAVLLLHERLKDAQHKEEMYKGGMVTLITMGQTCEVELRLSGHYAITPKITNAIKAIDGVVYTESL